MTKIFKYQGFWIEIFIDDDNDNDEPLMYFASVDMSDGVLTTESYPSKEEAEVAAKKLIDGRSNGGVKTCTEN